MKWPMLRFPPINLFSAPVQMKICRHTHWANYVSWGKQVCIEGRIQTRKYQDSEGKDRYWTEVAAHSVRFLGNKNDGMSIERTDSGAVAPGAPAMGAVSSSAPEQAAVSFDDDDIPF